jgi:hypothetical protein
MAVVDLYIASVIKPWKASSMTIDHQFSLRSTMRVTVESVDASYTPVVGNDIKAYEDGTLIFGGLITSITRRKIPGSSVLVSDIVAQDYSLLASKRLTGERFGANGYANQKANDILRDLVSNCLGSDGIDVSAIPAGGGPTVALAEFDYSTVADAFDFIAELSARRWRIDFEKKLRLVDPAAPVVFATVTPNNGNCLTGSLQAEETQEQYGNKVVARGRRTTVPETTETFDGSHPDQPTDGTRKEWSLTNIVFDAPTVEVNSVAQTVGVASVDTGKDWYWRPNSAIVEQDGAAPALTGSDTLAITYVGEQINQAFAENTGAIAARATIEASSGIWERAYELTDPISVTDLQAYANAVLDRRDDLSTRITFDSDKLALLAPGDGLDFTGWGSVVSGTAIVTSIIISLQTLGTSTPATNNQRLVRRVEAQLGPILDNGFDFFRDLAGSVGGSAAVGGAVSGGGGGAPSPWVTITYASTITPNLALGSNHQCTLTGDVTVAIPTGASDGQEFRLWLAQDATGGHQVTLAAGYKTDGLVGRQEPLTAVSIHAVMVGTTGARVMAFNQGIL